MALASLEDLLIHELKDLLSAEKQLLKALPKMAKGASSEKLRAAFEKHLGETEGQVQRLEKAFQLLGKPARAIHCKGMEGLVAEGSEMLGEAGDPMVIDAGLIGAAQRVEHYEIAAYGTARSIADLLGHDEVSALLQDTLDEEKATDEALSELATSEINVEAESAEGE